MANVFFHLINKLFPTEHKFQEIFNWNTSRLTHSCLPILQSLINNYNQNILWEQLQIIPRTCNCVKEENCSVNNICLTESSLYYATVTCDEKNYTKLYKRICKTTFRKGKPHYLNTPICKNDLKISTEYWTLKTNQPNPKLSWQI